MGGARGFSVAYEIRGGREGSTQKIRGQKGEKNKKLNFFFGLTLVCGARVPHNDTSAEPPC